jgi:hypothetical protein
LYQKHKVELNHDTNGFMHNSRKKLFAKIIYRKRIKSWNANLSGKPVVHESVLLRKLNQQNEESPAYASWILELDFDTETWPEEIRKIARLS